MSDDATERTPVRGVARFVADRSSHDALDSAPVRFLQQVADRVWMSWSVVEVDARGVPGALGARCLLFMRDDCIRRVWKYPAHWRTLDAEELAALSWQR